MIPLVGFLPASDPRVAGTVDAIQRELLVDGLVLRYASEQGVDGLPPGEGVFLPCSFWLADNLCRCWDVPTKALALFERLAGLVQRRRPASPRSTTRPRSGCSATSPRRSRTCRW